MTLLNLFGVALVGTSMVRATCDSMVVGDATATCDSASGGHAASLLQKTQPRAKQALDLPSKSQSGPTFRTIPETVLRSMALPEPYLCDFIHSGLLMQPPRFFRFRYCGGEHGCKSICGKKDLSDGLHPGNLSKTYWWMDSARLLMPIGALPCCPTPPHCRAPVCRSSTSPVLATGITCTKSKPLEIKGWLTHRTLWPAYFGAGGSFPLDVAKHWDVLMKLFGNYEKNMEAFDLAFDLGADWGSLTESWTSRKLAKDYILIDAVPNNKYLFEARFHNATYLKRWYSSQVVGWPASKPRPQFHFLPYALSNQTGGSFDMCNDGPGHFNAAGLIKKPCPVPIVTLDSIIASKLPPVFKKKLASAQSAYVKTDLEGMDQLAVDGMQGLLNETRGAYANGKSRYLVNFMMIEFCPRCIIQAREQNGLANYSLGTLVHLLERLGFELFLMGPRYVPLSHDSWHEEYDKLFTDSYSCPDGLTLKEFKEVACQERPASKCKLDKCFGAADLFAVRASHPRLNEIKLALGACKESKDFDINDDQYDLARS